MNNENLLHRARLLIEQNREDMAAENLRLILSQYPNCAEAHSLLALCLSKNKDTWQEATHEAQQAVGLAPNDFYGYYVLAFVLQKRNRLDEARDAIEQALQIDATSAEIHGLKASILFQQMRWADAQAASEEGLALDPENEECAMYRSLALERQGLLEQSEIQSQQVVAKNPDSSYAHATRGWALLHQSNYEKAAESFREALRLDPTNEMARVGMVQALNSKHLVFRIVFHFFAFMGRLAGAAQWAIILGMFLGTRILRSFANANPEWKPYVSIILIVYIAFCVLTWIAAPLFNTFLRFHPFGKYLLSNKERLASNGVATLIGIGLLGGTFQAINGNLATGLMAFLLPVLLAMPLSSAFEVPEGWPQVVAIVCSVLLAILAITCLCLLFLQGPWELFAGLFGLGIMSYGFLGNFLAGVTVKR